MLEIIKKNDAEEERKRSIYQNMKRESRRILREEKEKSWDDFTKKLEEDLEGNKRFKDLVGNKKLVYKMMRN